MLVNRTACRRADGFYVYGGCMKRIFAIILSLLTLTALVACSGGGDSKEYRVMVVESEGITVTSQNPITVKEGRSAVFDVEVGSNYVVDSVSAGSYDRDRGKLTVENVSADMRIEFTLREVDYDVTAEYTFMFIGGALDECSVPPIQQVRAGTKITVRANDEDRIFRGWTLGMNIADGAEEVISPHREYSFFLTPEMADADGYVMLFANYSDTVEFKYHLNGGTLNQSSVNYIGNQYYSTEKSGDTVTVSYRAAYSSVASCASLFWDDGTFSRDGYILKEYNTKPDGTGDGYSLGSKFYIEKEGDVPTLYCIWARASDSSLFETRAFEYAMPQNTNAAKAPHWVKSGVMITKYNGNEETVVIPEKIGGKYVTGIAAGAFVDRDVKTLVMGRRILKIEDGALVGCDKLETVYYPDGIYAISDAWLDGESYTSLKNLYVNATIAPRNMGVTAGGFAYKLMKLLETKDEDRIIIVAGSSTYQGLGTTYLEALLDGRTVVNFATTRTANGIFYLEALGAYTHEGDIVLVAPENSIYMMGENRLYYNTLLQLEGMYNLFRNVDISNYENVFGGFAEFNSGMRYRQSPKCYEDIAVCADMNNQGDCLREDREGYRSELTKAYTDTYVVTFTNMVKSWMEVSYDDENFADFTAAEFADLMNMAFDKIGATGAQTYFTFAPVDENALLAEAKSLAWLAAYEELVRETYTSLDGILGHASDYVFHREYMYDNAFHVNDYGRTLRTYQMYLDLAELLGISEVKGILDVGTDFDGCMFESNPDGTPKYPRGELVGE